MGHSQASKAQNRERIVAEAARQVRSGGLESVSVGALMKSVGLTHGGFYGHFESREALLAQALARALAEGEAAVGGGGRASGGADFATLVRGYLSRRHRDARESGCAMAALVSDVGRSDEMSRQVMSTHIERFIALASDALGGDEARAMTVVSAMIGGLALSRVLNDPQRSDRLLKSVRETVTAMAAKP